MARDRTGHPTPVRAAGVPPPGGAVPAGGAGQVLGLSAGPQAVQSGAAGFVAALVHHHHLRRQWAVVRGPQEPPAPTVPPLAVNRP